MLEEVQNGEDQHLIMEELPNGDDHVIETQQNGEDHATKIQNFESQCIEMPLCND